MSSTQLRLQRHLPLSEHKKQKWQQVLGYLKRIEKCCLQVNKDQLSHLVPISFLEFTTTSHMILPIILAIPFYKHAVPDLNMFVSGFNSIRHLLQLQLCKPNRAIHPTRNPTIPGVRQIAKGTSSGHLGLGEPKVD